MSTVVLRLSKIIDREIFHIKYQNIKSYCSVSPHIRHKKLFYIKINKSHRELKPIRNIDFKVRIHQQKFSGVYIFLRLWFIRFPFYDCENVIDGDITITTETNKKTLPFLFRLYFCLYTLSLIYNTKQNEMQKRFHGNNLKRLNFFNG